MPQRNGARGHGDPKVLEKIPGGGEFDEVRTGDFPSDHRDVADVRMPDLTVTKRYCPRCHALLHRQHRSGLDRAVNLVYRVHRYRCHGPECGWRGLLHVKKRKQGRRIRILGNPLWAWGLAIAGALLLGLLLIQYITWIHSLTPPTKE